MSAHELAQKLVKELSRTYDEVAVLLIETDRTMVKLWNSEPSVVQSWLDWEVMLRLAKNKRMWILRFRTRNIDQILESTGRLIELADKVEESELYSPLPEAQVCKPLSDVYDPAIDKFSEDPSRLVEVLIDEALGAGAERVAGMISLGKLTKTLATSRGYECRESKTFVEAYARAFRGDFSGHWAHGSTRVNIEEVRKVGRIAGKYATITSSKTSITPGKYKVVISPLVVGNLMNYVGSMASALSVLTGFSFFAKYKLGDKVAHEKFSLYDKPRDATLPGATGFDDEGIETVDKPIIENGLFKSLLHNSGTAGRMGTKSTGNAGWIYPLSWNLEVSGGELSEEELISELREGLFITNNWYTRLQNYYEGAFSTVSRDVALYVKNGKVVGDVGRVRIAATFPQILSNIQGSTCERYDIWWWEVRTPTRAPYLLLEGINITKPEV